uniref:Uncharacterized protein n=1 Tax=Podoviridae sp. ctZih56 TaxID=2827741 RepID=A0A8S5SFC6_9CAUD|nr:MAG TPA: hypothetical protein [Podoviridae sp. ctZih56]
MLTGVSLFHAGLRPFSVLKIYNRTSYILWKC